ncbi:MAG: protein DA1, partial [bacterium]
APKCSACGVPSHRESLTKVGKESLCPYCLDHAKFCSLCGNRISGKYFIAGESQEQFCDHCYKTYPRCRACDRPMRRSSLTEDGVCASCAEKLPRCKACGKTIVGAYFTVKFKGEYCAECARSRPDCYACGAPVSNIYWKLPDGRFLCESCKNRSLFREDQVRTIMNEVVELAGTRLGLVVKRPWTLRLNKLNTNGQASVNAARQGLEVASPISGKEMGIYIERGDYREIVLLYGIPISMIYETAAHEFTHAWQAENCPPSQSLELREGFAQWVAAQILEVKGFNTTLEKLQSRMDKPYGTGYQRIARIEAAHGRSGIMEYVRTAAR